MYIFGLITYLYYRSFFTARGQILGIRSTWRESGHHMLGAIITQWFLLIYIFYKNIKVLMKTWKVISVILIKHAYSVITLKNKQKFIFSSKRFIFGAQNKKNLKYFLHSFYLYDTVSVFFLFTFIIIIIYNIATQLDTVTIVDPKTKTESPQFIHTVLVNVKLIYNSCV